MDWLRKMKQFQRYKVHHSTIVTLPMYFSWFFLCKTYCKACLKVWKLKKTFCIDPGYCVLIMNFCNSKVVISYGRFFKTVLHQHTWDRNVASYICIVYLEYCVQVYLPFDITSRKALLLKFSSLVNPSQYGPT